MSSLERSGFVLEPTISGTFLARVARTPDREAFFFRKKRGGWESRTFAAFYSECRNTAARLIGSGVAPGDRVALLAQTRYEWALCDLAILGSGAVTVPLYPSSAPEEIEFILAQSGARALIAECPALLSKSPRFEGERWLLEGEAPGARALLGAGGPIPSGRASDFDRNLRAAKPSDLFTICYTSGTTGTPKGAMLTHGNMMSVLSDCAELVAPYFQEGKESVLTFLPFSHVLGRVESMAVHAFGFKQYFARALETLPEDFVDARPTVVFAVPRLFEKAHAKLRERVASAPPLERKLFESSLRAGRACRERERQGRRPGPVLSAARMAADSLVFSKVRERLGGRMRFAICGGAPLPPTLGEDFAAMGIEVLEGYGLTETCAPVAINRPGEARFGTVGKPMPEVQVRIAGDGEVLLRSRKVFAGYFRMPDETSAVLEPATDGGLPWLHTGDLGELDPDGRLRITGRKKDLIVTSGGKNVAPQKIEAMAAEFPWISHLIVHGDGRNYLTALVAIEPESRADASLPAKVDAAIASINARLASYETIKRYAILPEALTVESGELTPSLKVRRRVVEERYRPLLDGLYASR